MKTELEPTVQNILGEGWKEVAGKYIDKLEEEDMGIKLNDQRKNRRRG